MSREQKDLYWSGVFPDALERDHHEDRSGNRWTTVRYPAPFRHPIQLSPAYIFTHAKKRPSILLFRLSWDIILPWLTNSQEEIQEFWKHFDDPHKSLARSTACWGQKYQQWQAERMLLGSIHIALQMQNSEQSGEFRQVLWDLLKDQCADWVFNAVAHDHEAFRRMYETIKKRETAIGKKGDSLSAVGSVFDAFSSIVGEEERLPSKSEVRVKAGLGQDYSRASGAFARLGLRGLPKKQG